MTTRVLSRVGLAFRLFIDIIHIWKIFMNVFFKIGLESALDFSKIESCGDHYYLMRTGESENCIYP